MNLDPSVRSIVTALWAYGNVETFSSCGGHVEPDLGQVPEGHFIVDFVIENDVEGWKSLERIAWAAGETLAEVVAWWDGGLNFELRGDGDVNRDELVQRLRAIPPS